MKIYQNITELIGNTPLVELKNLEKEYALPCRLVAKLERQNPGGSAKDRIALEMIRQAEQNGTLKPDSVLVEPTSGNTGVGLAAVAATLGYRVILTMPETMSEERRKLLAAYGAELILTSGEKGMAGAIEKANEIVQNTPGAVLAGQFVNPANPDAHYKTTGPEIWRDTDGEIAAFVAGAGTGGTVSGTAKFLKEQNPAVHIVAVEPENSAVLSGKKPGSHGLQGIGAGFIPEVLDVSLLDEIIPVSDEDAYRLGRELASKEGILSGITGGAAAFAGIKIGKRKEFSGKIIVILLPDTGERYLSTPLFSE